VSTRPASVLERILAETRAEVDARRSAGPPPDTDGRTLPPGAFAAALKAPDGIAVIAEFKRRSPSAGTLAAAPDLVGVISAYERGGAAALSILTERPNFDGSLEDLRAARAASTLPILRKDFIVDSYQLQESVAAGADAVLLIAAALSASELAGLLAAAGRLGLDVLVEIHDQEELDAALAAAARIVGVNNRDLRDFSVDLQRTEQLAGRIPADTIAVSESGIGTPEQLRRLENLGINAVLVGERLMRADDPAAALRSLRTL
jgi:indole-3-glycerol phosphate synthase